MSKVVGAFVRAGAGIGAVVLTVTAWAVPAQADPPDPAAGAAERSQVPDVMRTGGLGASRAARAVLLSPDAEIHRFLATDLPALRVQDDRVRAGRLMSLSGPAMTAA